MTDKIVAMSHHPRETGGAGKTVERGKNGEKRGGDRKKPGFLDRKREGGGGKIPTGGCRSREQGVWGGGRKGKSSEFTAHPPLFGEGTKGKNPSKTKKRKRYQQKRKRTRSGGAWGGHAESAPKKSPVLGCGSTSKGPKIRARHQRPPLQATKTSGRGRVG